MRNRFVKHSGTSLVLLAASAVVATSFGFERSARADVENIYSENFDSRPLVTGAVNDGSVLDSVEPFFYSYSGNDPAAVGSFKRRVGISADGVGGSHAAFLDMDSSAVKTSTGGDTWWYAGIGRYVYVDPFIGAPYANANQVTWTVQAKGDGLTPVPQDAVTMRFAVQRGGSLPDYFAAETQGFFDANYNTIGGSLDTFNQVGGDTGFTGAAGFIAQLQPNTGAFGNDAGNRMTIDNFQITTVRSNWKGGVDNSLDNAANWSENTLPSGQTAFPIFRAASGSAHALTLSIALNVNRLDFNSTDSYTIGGTGSITIAGNSPGAFDDESPDQINTISVPVTVDKPTAGIRVNAGGTTLRFSGGLTSTGSLSKDREGSVSAKFIRTAGSLNILAGTVSLQAGATTTSKVAALGFQPVVTGGTPTTDTLDLNDGRLIVDYTTTSPLASLKAALANGKIKSSLATANAAIVIAEKTDFPSLTTFGDLTPDSTSVLLLATLRGDSDLNRTVNFNDLLTLAKNYGQSAGATWAKGDNTGDGAVNFDDLLNVAKNYNGTFPTASPALSDVGGAAFAADVALAQSLVPEPTTAATAMLLSSALLSRRRRSGK